MESTKRPKPFYCRPSHIAPTWQMFTTTCKYIFPSDPRCTNTYTTSSVVARRVHPYSFLIVQCQRICDSKSSVIRKNVNLDSCQLNPPPPTEICFRCNRIVDGSLCGKLFQFKCISVLYFTSFPVIVVGIEHSTTYPGEVVPLYCDALVFYMSIQLWIQNHKRPRVYPHALIMPEQQSGQSHDYSFSGRRQSPIYSVSIDKCKSI